MKRLVIVLLVTALLGVMAGCGGDKGDRVTCNDAVTQALSKITTTKIDTTIPYGDDIYQNNFEKLYNFSMDKVSDGAIAYASTGGFADEISMMKASDSNGAAGIKKYMEARLDKRINDFQNYKPEEATKLENAKIIVQKQYVILVIAKDAEDIGTEIRKLI